MKNEWLTSLFLVPFMILLFVLTFQVIWNEVMPLFGLPSLDFLQTLALLVLLYIFWLFFVPKQTNIVVN